MEYSPPEVAGLKYASLALASVVCLVALCSTLRVLHPKLETQAAAKAAGVHIRKRLIFQFIIQKTPLVEKNFSRPLKSETFILKNYSYSFSKRSDKLLSVSQHFYHLIEARLVLRLRMTTIALLSKNEQTNL